VAMRRFATAHTLSAPLEKVLAFYSSPVALQRLTPPPVAVRAVRCEPLGERSLAEFDLCVPFTSIGVRWLARHSGFTSEKGMDGTLVKYAFVDKMELGPLASWRHLHEFSRTKCGGTRVADSIDYSHLPGVRGFPTRVSCPCYPQATPPCPNEHTHNTLIPPSPYFNEPTHNTPPNKVLFNYASLSVLFGWRALISRVLLRSSRGSS